MHMGKMAWLAAVFGLTGCMASPPGGLTDRAALYAEAVKSAAVPGESAAVELHPVTGDEAVMVSWIDAQYYPRGEQPLDFKAVWVTAEPQLRDLCRATPGGDTVARLEEMLGLPPGGGEGRSFVVMRVQTADMFRPCPDTRIDQRVCPLEVPETPPQGADPAQWSADLSFVFKQMLSSYRETNGYPFTRLGYTYDWSAYSADHAGPSEYVIRKGATVSVTEIFSTAEYCRPQVN